MHNFTRDKHHEKLKNMLKIAIVEDEPAAIENIQRIIALSKIEINIVGTAQSVQEGVILIRNTNPDLCCE